MKTPIDRRDFFRYSAAAGVAARLGDFGFLGGLPAVSADEAKVPRAKVRLSPDIEPLVALIEDTPRGELIAKVADRIRDGLCYQDLLAALLLAGVRGIQPRPVGFKFHAVLVINSAHLASIAATDRDRWLPLIWALDNFKASQSRNRAEGNWVMAPAREAALPSPGEARGRFQAAMDAWDEQAADRAVTALARTAGAGEILETLWLYGARDFRDIGHKAIYTANAWRTLQVIGWRHAEPVLRSLAYAVLEHEGDNPARRDAEPDRPWRDNQARARRIRAGWQQGKADPQAAAALLAALRQATPAEASEQVVNLLNAGADPRSAWDGLFLFAGELLMRQPGIIGIHCVTSANALHYGYQAVGTDETRRLLLLQAAAFLALFRKRMAAGLKGDRWADTLEKAEVRAHGPAAVEEVFTDVSRDRLLAARKTLALLESGTVGAEALMAAARRLVFTKGRDAHDYKFSSAALEDYYHTSPAWRNRYLATSMFNLRGAGDRDNDLIQRTRGALGA